jgi:hypothetical protein
MTALSLIDTTFDFRSDTPAGKDPDALSPTLRKYHKHLWSRLLPSGAMFTLDDTNPKIYLHHISELGEFSLSSDSAIHSFSRWKSMAHIMSQIKAEEIEEFKKIGYTIGGMLIFPANRVDSKSTINGARGMHPLIKDRIDLTLECIRRYYINENSPLSDTLGRYKNFFELFSNFQGYINFFLLQDLVTEDFKSIKFLIRFDNFKPPIVPTNLDEYLTYKDLAIQFVHNRNKRIASTVTSVT